MNFQMHIAQLMFRKSVSSLLLRSTVTFKERILLLLVERYEDMNWLKLRQQVDALKPERRIGFVSTKIEKCSINSSYLYHQE